MKLVSIISRHPEMLTEDLRPSLLQGIYRDSRDQYRLNLLLSSCNTLNSDTFSTIRLLHKLGADLNARDQLGSSALLILALKDEDEEFRG